MLDEDDGGWLDGIGVLDDDDDVEVASRWTLGGATALYCVPGKMVAGGSGSGRTPAPCGGASGDGGGRVRSTASSMLTRCPFER
jgi:hypothetical protein